MNRFLRSLGIDQELGCMVPWRELRDVFFGRSLGGRERCDRLAAAGDLEPLVWHCTSFRSGNRRVARQVLTC